ncbi:MAG: metallophosphoesterase family protein [Rhodospirillales bacterium]|jgi:predicted phosphodiesterase|nr:metallophosphoesterase family protein [Rhodospirillales bacterium]
MTRLLDLGILDGPVLVFGGPYGNLEATEVLLAEATSLGIGPSRILCTGDVVAYCADAQATVERIRGAGMAVVQGNCEESLGSDADDCGCGFEEGTACDTLSAQWYAYARQTLDADAKKWMADLPRRITFTMAGRRWAAIHGGVERVNRFLFASTAEADLADELDTAGVEGIVAGHCGLPFTRHVGTRLWHNAGVIGLPANDGTPRVWYSLLTPGTKGITVEQRSLEYDHGAAARKMVKRGLPQGYANALHSGLWPSLDVLPAAERKATGRPLAARSVSWPR